MARINAPISNTPSRQSPSTFGAGTPRARQTTSTYRTLPTSPSGASDKENHPTSATVMTGRGKGRMAPPGNLPTPNSETATKAYSAKRRRINPARDRRSGRNNGDGDDERRYYDPDQDPEERQALKRQSRALEREFNDNRDAYLRADHNGLQKTISQANALFQGVKQTSDATLDSRLMVNVSDLLSKKSAQMVLGDTSTGLDVDEFVSKAISFMNKDRAVAGYRDSAPSATQRRRRQQSQRLEDGDEDEPMALDWASLGCNACFPSNIRPPVPGFLLGPLSVQKKARTQTQRRARQARDTNAAEVRPETLTRDDLGQSENNTLTVICSNIRITLQRHCDRAELAVEAAGELTDDLMKEYRVADTGGPHLFDFVVNPHSFGQTVENLFYTSFLIKEGNIGIDMDSDELPTLIPVAAVPEAERREKGSRKHQAVFGIDHATWLELIAAYDIREPLIEHRVEASTQQHPGNRGWYA